MAPIYVVSGYMRTGTSMMMKACIEGGLEAVYDPVRDEVLKAQTADDDWTIQHGESVYEPSRPQVSEIGFPRMHAGKVLKMLYGGVAGLAPHKGGYHFVFMRRPLEEIRQSYEAAFLRGRAAPILYNGRFDEVMDLAIETIHNRKDTLTCTVLQYHKVLRCPKKVFTTLRDKGWPIDVEAAALVPDLEMCRFREAELVAGI